VASGDMSVPINLNVGTNIITIVVTAEDGATTQTYTITVTRAAADIPTLPVAQATPSPSPGTPEPNPGATVTNDQGLILDASGKTPYIHGDADTHTVRPNDSIKRSEVAQILYNLALNSDKGNVNGQLFSDVPSGAWYYQAVQYLGQNKTLQGYIDGTFAPNQDMTRAELAHIIAGFYTESGSVTVNFSDISGSWAQVDIAMCASHGIINGYADGTFRPGQPLTRAEAIVMINRFLGISSAPGTYAAADNPYVDLAPGFWAYDDILAASL